MIQPIVEGQGDVEALPVLLRRLSDEAQAYELGIGRPIRRPRSQMVRKTGLGDAIRLARMETGCSSILVLLDGDDDCPRELAPKLQRWAATAAKGIPCAVVIAHREYEAWFLASVESLRGRRGVRPDAVSHSDPEIPRDAKGALEGLMTPDRSYHPTADQAALTALFDMSDAFRRSRSFRRMVNAFGHMLQAEGVPAGSWPPNWAATS